MYPELCVPRWRRWKPSWARPGIDPTSSSLKRGAITPFQCGATPPWVCWRTGGTPAVSNRARRLPLPTLDLRTFTDEQLRTVEAIFNGLRDKELKPAYLADAYPNRALLDRRVVCDLLSFDENTYAAVRRLAAKWCAEPPVHGGKARPRDARHVS